MIGFFLLLSCGNLLMFYLSLELATIPLAAVANFDLHRRRSSEGAMKMILSSAFSSGILLFGISLLYGSIGSLNFTAISYSLDGSPLQILSFVFVFAAFAFKLSIVPFHLWTADVYEGSPFPTTAYLSVVSKGAMAFIFIRFVYFVFQPFFGLWYVLLIGLALITLLVGNLFALRQQNIKRFLAFSSIAQVGFILIGILSNSMTGLTAVMYFIIVYIFSNLAAFGVATAIAIQTGKENIDDYKGLYQTNPFLSWIMALALFSLAGIPPTAGFFGKLFLLTAGGSNTSYWVIIIAALTMIISLFYYLKVIRAIFMDKNDSPIEKIQLSASSKLGLLVCGVGIVAAGVFSQLYEFIAQLLN
jgi:NADH-quinone oxidoreductase subunit N